MTNDGACGSASVRRLCSPPAVVTKCAWRHPCYIRRWSFGLQVPRIRRHTAATTPAMFRTSASIHEYHTDEKQTHREAEVLGTLQLRASPHVRRPQRVLRAAPHVRPGHPGHGSDG